MQPLRGASTKTPTEHRRKHGCIAVLGISGREYQCHRLASRALAEFRQPLPLGVEFAHVQAPELIEAIGIVPIPTTKGVAWSEFARPIVYVSLISSQPAGPEAVDEHTMTITWIGNLIRSFQPNVHLATVTVNSSATLTDGLPPTLCPCVRFLEIPKQLRIA
jgi:hypothetical protein